MTRSFTPLGLLLAGVMAACAGGERPPYEGFRPPEAALARLDDPAFAQCVDEASAPYRLNTRTIQGCFDAEGARLDSLLATARGRLPESDAVAGDAEREAWEQAARESCAAEHPWHNGWGWIFEFQSCELDETKRRIVWLESPVR